jgi:DNA-directed RNA polymerase specialized sigma subunit
MLRSIFLNQKRKQREYVVEGQIYEQPEDDGPLEGRMMINDELSKMSFVEREALLCTSEESLREIGKKSGVHYLTIFKLKNKYLDKLKKQINGKAIDWK